MSDRTPYIGFGLDTLSKLPRVAAGDEIPCPHCGGEHIVTSVESNPPGSSMQFYQCLGKTYMAGVNGVCTIGQKVDMSGEI